MRLGKKNTQKEEAVGACLNIDRIQPFILKFICLTSAKPVNVDHTKTIQYTQARMNMSYFLPPPCTSQIVNHTLTQHMVSPNIICQIVICQVFATFCFLPKKCLYKTHMYTSNLAFIRVTKANNILQIPVKCLLLSVADFLLYASLTSHNPIIIILIKA